MFSSKKILFSNKLNSINATTTAVPTTAAPLSWTQVGSDINGEAVGDNSGYSVSLSSDGNRVAIGEVGANVSSLPQSDWSNYAGRVKVYDWNGSSWTQVGSDIDGEAIGDWSGYSVSLSSDGDRVAIGARYNEGSGAAQSGHVRIYYWSGSTWTQLGSDIDGEANVYDWSGTSVSLSSDGNRVAIGAIGAERSYIGTLGDIFYVEKVGRVRVYDWNGAAWVQLGSDINGENRYDQLGYYVNLSSDGNRVAMGSGKGYVRVYHWTGTEWTQLGQSIRANLQPTDQAPAPVCLNDNGNRVAIGATHDGVKYSGLCEVYELNDTVWVRLGLYINGENLYDENGYSVSLSGDGNRVAT